MEIPFTIFFKSELFKSEKPKIKKKKSMKNCSSGYKRMHLGGQK
jgi:hypothetical protein